jgi:membrane protease YdiL (CAAX protease family)
VLPTDPRKRTIRLEIAVVLAVTFGLSAYTALVSLIEAVLLGLSGQKVALNRKLSPIDLINLALNLASVFQLVAWGLLGLYLLWRSGLGPSRIGLGRFRWRTDLLGGLGLAALIGIPGLGLYVAGRALGIGVAVVPSELGDTWWRIPVLLVVAFLMTRLRQLGMSPVKVLVISSLLRGAYHLYQGFGAGLGNLAMGLVFGYVWQRTGRLWPLIVAHGLIDAVAFVGYALAAGHLDWLR